jgi:hypothetical protein
LTKCVHPPHRHGGLCGGRWGINSIRVMVLVEAAPVPALSCFAIATPPGCASEIPCVRNGGGAMKLNAHFMLQRIDIDLGTPLNQPGRLSADAVFLELTR